MCSVLCLAGERAFFMFCEHGGAKEQWYIGLSRLDHQGDSVQLLQDMYSRYSALCHQKQYAVFPFLGSSPNSSGFSSPKERSSRNPRRGWMRRWWVNGRNGGGKSAGDVQELRVRGSLDLDEEGNPFAEMERMWMREGWASKGEENEVLRKHGAQRRAKGENQTVAQSPGPAKGTLELTVDVDGEGKPGVQFLYLGPFFSCDLWHMSDVYNNNLCLKLKLSLSPCI